MSSVHSKFVGHSTEIIWQSKIKEPLTEALQDHFYLRQLTRYSTLHYCTMVMFDFLMKEFQICMCITTTSN